MIIAVLGPTGVGKTKLSIELAKIYNAEIINGDSVQIYKGLDIGSAKITEEEKEGIPHHLFDIKEVDEEYTLYDYQKDARACIKEIQEKGKNVIIVGGGDTANDCCGTAAREKAKSIALEDEEERFGELPS